MESNCLIDNSNEGPVLLTIAIPTYKRFSLLKETLRSVFSLEFSIPIEVIVVDNDPGNEENVFIEMNEFKNLTYKYYKNKENYGMFGNWNQCLKLGEGKYITILHDDDLLLNNFAHCVENCINDFNFPIFGFNHRILDERDINAKVKKNLIYTVAKKLFHKIKKTSDESKVISLDIKDLFWGNIFMGTLGVIMLRENALLLSGFDEKKYPIADYEFWCRWTRKFGSIHYFNIEVSCYRIRENESMKSEVINAFIEENCKLRMDIAQNNDSFKYKDILLLKKIDKLSFNFNWRKKDDYKMTINDMFYYIYLKLKVIFVKNRNKFNLKK